MCSQVATAPFIMFRLEACWLAEAEVLEGVSAGSGLHKEHVAGMSTDRLRCWNTGKALVRKHIPGHEDSVGRHADFSRQVRWSGTSVAYPCCRTRQRDDTGKGRRGVTLLEVSRSWHALNADIGRESRYHMHHRSRATRVRRYLALAFSLLELALRLAVMERVRDTSAAPRIEKAKDVFHAHAVYAMTVVIVLAALGLRTQEDPSSVSSAMILQMVGTYRLPSVAQRPLPPPPWTLTVEGMHTSCSSHSQTLGSPVRSALHTSPNTAYTRHLLRTLCAQLCAHTTPSPSPSPSC